MLPGIPTPCLAMWIAHRVNKAVDVAGCLEPTITCIGAESNELLRRVAVRGRVQVSARTTGGRASSFENLPTGPTESSGFQVGIQRRPNAANDGACNQI